MVLYVEQLRLIQGQCQCGEVFVSVLIQLEMLFS